jgi:IS30 family transposase
MNYHHLTKDARCQIYTLKSKNYSIRAIAEFVRVAPSTISREIRRNTGSRGYRHQQAHQFACVRRQSASSTPRSWSLQLQSQIDWMITTQQWSPEQISGRLKLRGTRISHERIYQYINQDRHRGGKLYKHLRHQGKPYYYKRSKTAGKGLIPGRIDIDERPDIVEKKTRVGDWEADTIIGPKHKGALLSLVDRASKFTLLRNIHRKTANNVIANIADCFKEIVGHAPHTITFDNGKEFAGHRKISSESGAQCFFAKPYSSWQRGLNEHTNGLIRQYLPKKQTFDKVTDADIRYIQDKLNRRPRKILNYQTPSEVFEQLTKVPSVALRC